MKGPFIRIVEDSRSRWPPDIWLGSSAVRLLGLRIPIEPGLWMSVS